MWLLHTRTATLRCFNKPEDVPGGYAILSHVWGDESEEDTFQKVQDAAKQCEPTARWTAASTPNDILPSGCITDRVQRLEHVIQQQQLVIDQLQRMMVAMSGQKSERTSDSYDNIVVRDTSLHDCSPVSPTSMQIPHVTGGDMFSYRRPTTPRDLLSKKIQNFLIQAEKQGFEWAWADTCCIDKTSSAELTEAINSMFRYYALSAVCYVYLADVSPSSGAQSFDFGNSQWLTRGWTLQELLAPKTVLFMSSNWTQLRNRFGNKYALANDLERITGIPASVLRFEKDVTEVSVAARMSWAANRYTTRIEDEAYCLFGLFGITMPTLYGEGRNAFYRLQEEIMRTSNDLSLFACGSSMELEGLPKFPAILSRPSYHLFAPSPRLFKESGNVTFEANVAEVLPINRVSTSRTDLSMIVLTFIDLVRMESLRRCSQ